MTAGAVVGGHVWMVRAVADLAQQRSERCEGDDAKRAYLDGIEAGLRWACGDGYADDALRQLVREATDPDDE